MATQADTASAKAIIQQSLDQYGLGAPYSDQIHFHRNFMSIRMIHGNFLGRNLSLLGTDIGQPAGEFPVILGKYDIEN